MSKYKRGHQQSVDKNELEIIKALEDAGIFVVRHMDDFLAYTKDDELIQVEVKNESPFNKNGTLKSGKIKDSQYKMLCYANLCYIIVWSKEDALIYIHKDNGGENVGITPIDFKRHYKEWLTTKELNRLRQLPWWNLDG